jgi:oligopeptide/dipeptide ABC transporter ATP-binding protein
MEPAMSGNTAPLLSMRGVTTELVQGADRLTVVRDLDLELGRGEVVGLVGESGSGKSMTARTILRLLPRGAEINGEIEFDGGPVPEGGSALRELRARRIAMIFQDPRAHVDPLYTNGDHITEPLRVHEGLDKAQARERAHDLMTDVGIADPERVLDCYPGQVSGGMLQRVMIAGALAGDPDLLIADEPTTALDVTIQAEILRIFDRLRRERGLAILFITHDLDVAAALCDRVVVMYAGRVMEEQTTGGLFAAPAHPYTAGLLRARPQLETRAEELETIPGRPTGAVEAPAGCPFHPRCPYAHERCATTTPPLVAVRGHARSACIRVDELADELAAKGIARV